MTKSQLVRKAVQVLKNNNIGKSVSLPKKTFTIIDDEGSSKVFNMKMPDKEVSYTASDVEDILNVLLAILEDCIRQGDTITISGIGSIGVKYRQPRMVKIPGTNEWVDIPGFYSPKFSAGSLLKAASRVYSSTVLGTLESDIPEPIYDEYEKEDDYEGWHDAFKEAE